MSLQSCGVAEAKSDSFPYHFCGVYHGALQLHLTLCGNSQEVNRKYPCGIMWICVNHGPLCESRVFRMWLSFLLFIASLGLLGHIRTCSRMLKGTVSLHCCLLALGAHASMSCVSGQEFKPCVRLVSFQFFRAAARNSSSFLIYPAEKSGIHSFWLQLITVDSPHFLLTWSLADPRRSPSQRREAGWWFMVRFHFWEMLHGAHLGNVECGKTYKNKETWS